jgi:archaemetzincin
MTPVKPIQPELCLLPIGKVELSDLEELARRLSTSFREFKINILRPMPVPNSAYNKHRDQFIASYFIEVAKAVNRPCIKTLAVTEVDLYAGHLNFVFGQAEIRGTAAVISLYRLKVGVSREKFISRMVKEAVHELGHTFGLGHCNDAHCVMHFSNCLADTDFKSEEYCERCGNLLRVRVR